MLIVYGSFQCKPEQVEEMRRMSLDLVAVSAKEQGCILYRFLEDAGAPGSFVFFEKWRSREDLEAHFQQSYFKDFADRFPSMIVGDALIEAHEVASTEKIA